MVLEQTTYNIHLPQFEGPFDLLLFFIERDELDIQDIPISRITHDFLDYIHKMESLNMEVASEFILVASTLMKIKARMLLPRPKLDANGNPEDPRTELVSRLLEYKRYKEVMGAFEVLESDSAERFKRVFARQEEQLFFEQDAPQEELMGMDLYSLARVFQRVMERHQGRMATPRHVIRPYPYSMDQVKQSIRERLETRERIDFVSFILDQPDKYWCVFSFLSVLEMTAAGHLRLVIGEGFNNFWICRPELAEAS